MLITPFSASDQKENDASYFTQPNVLKVHSLNKN